MTHEYVIALNGVVQATTARATAVGWADEFILAVGTDESVRAISRGDSTFLDVEGCAITPLPRDLAAAQAFVRERAVESADVGRLLHEIGLLEPGATIEMGAPADLAFWRPDGLVATVRGGHFTDGDAHRGPFEPPAG